MLALLLVTRFLSPILSPLIGASVWTFCLTVSLSPWWLDTLLPQYLAPTDFPQYRSLHLHESGINLATGHWRTTGLLSPSAGYRPPIASSPRISRFSTATTLPVLFPKLRVVIPASHTWSIWNSPRTSSRREGLFTGFDLGWWSSPWSHLALPCLAIESTRVLPVPTPPPSLCCSLCFDSSLPRHWILSSFDFGNSLIGEIHCCCGCISSHCSLFLLCPLSFISVSNPLGSRIITDTLNHGLIEPSNCFFAGDPAFRDFASGDLSASALCVAHRLRIYLHLVHCNFGDWALLPSFLALTPCDLIGDSVQCESTSELVVREAERVGLTDSLVAVNPREKHAPAVVECVNATIVFDFLPSQGTSPNKIYCEFDTMPGKRSAEALLRRHDRDAYYREKARSQKGKRSLCSQNKRFGSLVHTAECVVSSSPGPSRHFAYMTKLLRVAMLNGNALWRTTVQLMAKNENGSKCSLDELKYSPSESILPTKLCLDGMIPHHLSDEMRYCAEERQQSAEIIMPPRAIGETDVNAPGTPCAAFLPAFPSRRNEAFDRASPHSDEIFCPGPPVLS